MLVHELVQGRDVTVGGLGDVCVKSVLVDLVHLLSDVIGSLLAPVRDGGVVR